MPPRLTAILIALTAIPAHAVIVRGRVTDPFGRPLPGARVQLILGARVAGDTISSLDGAYEIRSAASGRFVLLASSATSSRHPAIQIGSSFYAGRTDLLTVDLALDPAFLTPQQSTQTTLLPTPLPQLAEPTAQITADQLLPQSTPLVQLAELPSAFLVQQGPTGSRASLYLRGAAPNASKTILDSVSAEDLGGAFNLATLSTTGLSALTPHPAIELTSGPNPLYAADSLAGTLTLNTPEATSTHAVLTYSGDAGNLASLRNEAVLSLTRRRADLLAAFSRFDTDSGSPQTAFHLATSSANAGYHISAGTALRLTLRDDVSAAPLALPTDFFGFVPAGKAAAQNLYASASFDTRTAGNWHNLLRYGLVRKRAQTFAYALPALGLPVTITGANGYTASGTATLPPLPPREDFVTNRDEFTFQSDRPLAPTHIALLELRYQSERAADLTSAETIHLSRSHFAAAALLRGSFRHRLFYESSGTLDRSATLPLAGAPRLGLTFVPVQPGFRRFRGTTLHASAATGFREPAILQPNLYARARTVSFGIDQVLLPQKLTLRATWFHSQFSHESEPLTQTPQSPLSPTAAFRAQGLESTLHYQPFPRLFLFGGYTFLAALVEQSAAAPVFNPNLPAIPIGALTALPGARPFHRPPHTGFFAADYTGQRLTLGLRGSLASRSDSSTGLPQTPTLLLPNRNLSPAFAALDGHAALILTPHITVYTQLTNLLDDRHAAPLGFLSTPFLIRTGLRLRLGTD